MWGKPLVGLILCLAKKRRVFQSTNRRTPERFQKRRSFCCTGEKSPTMVYHPYLPGWGMNGLLERRREMLF